MDLVRGYFILGQPILSAPAKYWLTGKLNSAGIYGFFKNMFFTISLRNQLYIFLLI